MHRPTTDDIRHFKTGLAKTAPLALGVIPFGLAYGVVATRAGLTVAETCFMSLVVFAGASQFMAAVMIQAGAGLPLIVASTLLVNLRHLVMGLSLSPYLTETSPRWQRLIAFGLVDESYVATIAHFREQGEEQGNAFFLLASGALFYLVWNVTCLLGALAGQAISDPLKWGLDFAMPATFLTMLLPQLVSRRIGAVVVVAAVVATAGYLFIPGKWYIILAVVVATLTGVALEARAERAAAS